MQREVPLFILFSLIAQLLLSFFFSQTKRLKTKTNEKNTSQKATGKKANKTNLAICQLATCNSCDRLYFLLISQVFCLSVSLSSSSSYLCSDSFYLLNRFNRLSRCWLAVVLDNNELRNDKVRQNSNLNCALFARK